MERFAFVLCGSGRNCGRWARGGSRRVNKSTFMEIVGDILAIIAVFTYQLVVRRRNLVRYMQVSVHVFSIISGSGPCTTGIDTIFLIWTNGSENKSQ